MKKQLEAIVSKLEDLLVDAEERANSDNEKIADFYTIVAEAIQQAIDALKDGVAAWDDK